MTGPAATQQDEPLKRDIGLLGSAMLVLNGIVGASIFALPGTLLADFGAFSPFLFPVFGLLVLLIALPLGEAASYFDRTGGPVVYTREAFGPFISFQVGWCYYIARFTAFAASTTVFISYATALNPGLSEGAPRAVLIVAITAALAIINIVGIKRAVRALDAISVLKIAPLVIFALLGAAFYGAHGVGPIELPAMSQVERASLLVLYAFMGFETSLVVGGETKDAKRTIPRAMIGTLIIMIGFYFLVQYGYAAAMAGETATKAPLVAFGEKLFGRPGEIIIIIAALFSVTGNLLASMTGAPRLAFALARDGQLPRWFGEVSPRFATPVNAILFMAVMAGALALSGTFAALAVISTLSRLFVYLASLAALPVIRRKRAAAPHVGAMRLAAPAILAGGVLFCLWAVFQSSFEAWKAFGALFLLGSIFYAAEHALARRRRLEGAPESG